MANIKIGISSGYKPQDFGKPSRESTVSYLYAYKISEPSSSSINFPAEKKDYSEITKNENFLFALNYTAEPVDGLTMPLPDGIVSEGLKTTPQRSIYKREVWRDNNNQVYYEKILHPVVLQNNVSRVIDYNVATNRNYEYIIYLTDQSTDGVIQREIHFPITTKWDYWSISELHKTTEQNVYTTSENETWLFKFNVEPGEQQQNVSKSQQDTLGKYPAFSYGKKNYTTSSVSCLLGSEMLPFNFLTTNYVLIRDDEDGRVHWGSSQYASEVYGGYTESRWKKLLDKCGMDQKVVNVFDTKITSNDSVDMLNEWKKLCNSGNPKLYKNSKGQSFIIQITEFSNSINESWDKQPVTINFSWTEIADASNARIIQTTEFTTDTSGSVSGGGDEPVVDYNMLSNKPQINGVELVGNKTDKDLYLEAEGNVQKISDETNPSITLDNNITYNLGQIQGLTTTFGTINDKYYTERQCSQAEINFTAAKDFVYTPPEHTTIIGEDVQDGKLSAKKGTSYNIGFGYVDNVMYAVCGIR